MLSARVYGSVIIPGSILRYLLVIIDELWEIHPTILNEDTQTFCRSRTHGHICRCGGSGDTRPSLETLKYAVFSIKSLSQCFCITILVRTLSQPLFNPRSVLSPLKRMHLMEAMTKCPSTHTLIAEWASSVFVCVPGVHVLN